MKNLIIFDCDGVLVDSEPISLDVECEQFAKIGLSLSRQEMTERFVGVSIKSVAEILKHEFNVTLPKGFLADGQEETLRRYPNELKPIPDIGQTLSRITQAKCVASSSQPHRIEISLKLTGLLDYFDGNIFSATMVEHGKPAPDLFLHAAANMGARPADCLVIEDSVPGIEAAKAAGMTVLAFAGGGHAQYAQYQNRLIAAQPDILFDDMNKLDQLIAAA